MQRDFTTIETRARTHTQGKTRPFKETFNATHVTYRASDVTRHFLRAAALDLGSNSLVFLRQYEWCVRH